MTSTAATAQRDIIRGLGRRVQGAGQGRSGQGNDSIHHRTNLEDSITISFRYLDSTRSYKLDSSISDFSKRYPIPATNIYLGNIGNASRSLLFSPNLISGFDPGFHAFDIYKVKLDKVRFFNTTRPYSEINYMLGSRVEQMIELMHTQNIKPNWNFALQYRLINSPGFFKNQKTNHNTYLFNSWFQSRSKRYNNYFAIVSNRLQSGESGGILDDKDYLGDPVYKDRFNIATKIGGDPQFGRDFFSTIITTANKYSEFTVLLRQQYDFGRKDSLVTDSTVVPLFYPSLRFEHNFQFDVFKYRFQDFPNTGSISYTPDSTYYQDTYGIPLNAAKDTVFIYEKWKSMTNDFSIYQFPDSRNQQQFIRVGLSIQNLTGEWTDGSKTFFNSWGHAEYRNKTRNQKWDIEANGKLFFTGVNSADYKAYISLQRYAGRKIGYIQLGFENASRTPSFIFDSRSSFYLMDPPVNFKKENNTHLFASFLMPAIKMNLSGHYYLMTNYTYITDYRNLQQEATLFNVLRIALEKTIRLGKRWNWHTETYFQQVVGDGPVHVPAIYTRNRLAYEGSLGFLNLNIALGLEFRYHTAYKADNYSPVLGQFFYQDSITIRNQRPDIAAYLHFRIKPFKAFVRMENLNTAETALGNLSFTHNNLVAPGYALPGLQFRLGIYWSFVN